MKKEEKLMKLRKRNAWSQEEFADKLNAPIATIESVTREAPNKYLLAA